MDHDSSNIGYYIKLEKLFKINFSRGDDRPHYFNCEGIEFLVRVLEILKQDGNEFEFIQNLDESWVTLYNDWKEFESI